MRRQLKHFNIDISHWNKTIKERQGWLKGKHHNWAPTIPLNEILIDFNKFEYYKN